MEFVPERIINETITELEQGMEVYENALIAFYTEQPGIGAYLLNEDFNSLTEGERDIMLYLSMIVYRSSVKLNPSISEVNIADIEAAEDDNWALLEDVTSHNFQERLNVFFDKSPQEDLLALIEDAIMEEEELLTKEGREPIFVGVKSIVDVLELTIDNG